jgi:cellulose synthase/poly-beta-1,6-N-acetylglucosamine synthase-like glycosyltransferase
VQAVLIVLFWISFASLCFSYLGYPLLMLLAARYAVAARPLAADLSDQPAVTVVIAAYNAEFHIAERIRNILASDYPHDRLTVLVASDGSSDATVDVVRSFQDHRIQAIQFPHRRGKALALVDAVRQASTEIVLFTDATSRFNRLSIRQLLRNFADPRVGLAAGKVSMIDESGAPAESLYWKSESMVRRSEAKLGIMLGATGALYAIRRALFVEPSRPIINDDMVLPMLVQLRHGCRFVFDETARAYALSTGGLAGEFRRRCRIGAGAFQSLSVLRDLLRPRHAKQAFAFASHKLLRWICPFLLLTLLITNALLLSSQGFQVFMWLQGAAYLLALIGLLAPQRSGILRVARVASSFLVMNLALATGFFRWLADPGNVIWNPTPRPILDASSSVSTEV